MDAEGLVVCDIVCDTTGRHHSAAAILLQATAGCGLLLTKGLYLMSAPDYIYIHCIHVVMGVHITSIFITGPEVKIGIKRHQ